MRSQLLGMIKSACIQMFHHEKISSNTILQPSVTYGSVSKRVEPAERLVKIEFICNCSMPRKAGDQITCGGCRSEFHMSCYLIKGNVMSPKQRLKLMKSFLCHDCKNMTLLDFNHENAQSKRLLKQLTGLQLHKLSTYVPIVRTNNHNFKELVTADKDLDQLNKINNLYGISTAA